ncbi:hypothetical protein ABWW58_11500 [Sporolactobacillus sp. STCC-11]|uniref:hypothetical protein n=1 Tax=Sporolactobacillus caesalpiniae TaxID=3230362 RepID=UPI0033961D0D
MRRLPDRRGKRAAEATLVQVTRLTDQSSIQIDSRGPGAFAQFFLQVKNLMILSHWYDDKRHKRLIPHPNLSVGRSG